MFPSSVFNKKKTYIFVNSNNFVGEQCEFIADLIP